jgi:hypothetical protein
VITIRTPLFLAIKDVAPQLRSEVTNKEPTGLLPLLWAP